MRTKTTNSHVRPHIPLDHACSVCSAPASAHHHYGAVVCYPCRAFFRRGTTKQFTCVTGYHSCPVDKSMKNRCRGCRYTRCLQVGMRPELVDATLLRKNLEPRRKPARNNKPSAAATTTTAATDGVLTNFLPRKGGVGSENSPLDLSKAAGEGGPPPTSVEGEDPNGETTTQMFYVFNPPTQTYEPVTIISLGEDGEEEAVIEDTGHLVEEVLQEAEQQSILPHTQHEDKGKLFSGLASAFKQELVEGFEQDVEREEIVSDSVPVTMMSQENV